VVGVPKSQDQRGVIATASPSLPPRSDAPLQRRSLKEGPNTAYSHNTATRMASKGLRMPSGGGLYAKPGPGLRSIGCSGGPDREMR
jgi:hypothetical protein